MASILIAFAIDAWWDEVQQERAEVAAVARILDEFEASREEIEFTAARHQSIYERGLAVLDVAYGRAQPDTALWDNAASALVMQFRTDLETHALDSYLAAEEFRTGSDPLLRERLTRHRLLIGQLRSQEEIAQEFVRGPITMAVSERFDLLLVGTGTLAPELMELGEGGRSREAEDQLLGLVRDPFVRNLITARLGPEWVAAVRSQRLLESLDELLPLLRAAAGR